MSTPDWSQIRTAPAPQTRGALILRARDENASAAIEHLLKALNDHALYEDAGLTLFNKSKGTPISVLAMIALAALQEPKVIPQATRAAAAPVGSPQWFAGNCALLALKELTFEQLWQEHSSKEESIPHMLLVACSPYVPTSAFMEETMLVLTNDRTKPSTVRRMAEDVLISKGVALRKRWFSGESYILT